MIWLVYITGLRGPSPRLIHDEAGGKPVLSEAERGKVIAQHRLTADECTLVRADKLSCKEIQKRYPPPGATGSDRPRDPSPVPPAPAAPKSGGGVAAKREIEVAA